MAKIESWRGTRIRSLRFQTFEVLHEDRIIAILISMSRWARIMFFLGLFYFYIPLVLSFFPWTRGFASTLFDYILTPIVRSATRLLATCRTFSS